MNPLLFMPSPRNIPEVESSWNDLPYDKFIVKNELEKPAYQKGREFFISHDEYDYIVICPDDIIINRESFNVLKVTVEMLEMSNLCGVAMVDETSRAYACKPIGVPFDAQSFGSYYYSPHMNKRKFELLPKNEVLEVGYTGFMIQFIRRDLLNHLSFEGGCQNGTGCMDIKQSQEMQKLKLPYLVHTGAFFTHLRRRQYKENKEWIKNGDHTKGYVIYTTV